MTSPGLDGRLPFVLICGGGSRLFEFRLLGSLFGSRVTEEPYVAMGGLLVVCPRAWIEGRLLKDDGTGGGALFPAAGPGC